MLEFMNRELVLMARSFLLGVEFMILYDLLRGGRILFPRPFAVVGAEDLIYWIYVGIKSSWLLYRFNEGIVRWYSVALIFAGMIFCDRTISRIFLNILKKAVRYIKMNKR